MQFTRFLCSILRLDVFASLVSSWAALSCSGGSLGLVLCSLVTNKARKGLTTYQPTYLPDSLSLCRMICCIKLSSRVQISNAMLYSIRLYRLAGRRAVTPTTPEQQSSRRSGSAIRISTCCGRLRPTSTLLSLAFLYIVFRYH